MLTGDAGLKSVLYSDLPLTWSEKDFREVFGHFGALACLKQLKPHDGHGRVFVTYEKASVARQSLSEFNGASIGNKKCRAEACRFDASDFEGIHDAADPSSKRSDPPRKGGPDARDIHDARGRRGGSRDRRDSDAARRERRPGRTEGPERQRDEEKGRARRRRRESNESLERALEDPHSRRHGGRESAREERAVSGKQQKRAVVDASPKQEKKACPEDKAAPHKASVARKAGAPNGRRGGQPLMSRLGFTTAADAEPLRAHPYKELDPTKAKAKPAPKRQAAQGTLIESQRLGDIAARAADVSRAEQQRVTKNESQRAAKIESQRMAAPDAKSKERPTPSSGRAVLEQQSMRQRGSGAGEATGGRGRAPIVQEVGLARGTGGKHHSQIGSTVVEVASLGGKGKGKGADAQAGGRDRGGALQFHKPGASGNTTPKTFQKPGHSAAPKLVFQRM
eukprot:TRINITY_DN20145_c0_g1_i1.p1 TRINITY_DN20145_c0_g1~~TRINITY_DN20145_c0_g1_i1.p1  ORF type:complete len:452 (+),score=97.75 TRINITY_DN20145_c0_g1_i1:84-1439(+)